MRQKDVNSGRQVLIKLKDELEAQALGGVSENEAQNNTLEPAARIAVSGQSGSHYPMLTPGPHTISATTREAGSCY